MDVQPLKALSSEVFLFSFSFGAESLVLGGGSGEAAPSMKQTISQTREQAMQCGSDETGKVVVPSSWVALGFALQVLRCYFSLSL